jgi:tripartite-type tricarboxylate transporter receptor subunit TctC
VVENRPGAGTTIGTNAVAKASADGLTLLLNSAAFAASAAIYAKLAYDPIKDFAPVSQVAFAPIVLVAAPSLNVKSIKDLAELAKEKSGQLNLVLQESDQAVISPASNSSALPASGPCTFHTKDLPKHCSIP